MTQCDGAISAVGRTGRDLIAISTQGVELGRDFGSNADKRKVEGGARIPRQSDFEAVLWYSSEEQGLLAGQIRLG